jgi:hypothetical protein
MSRFVTFLTLAAALLSAGVAAQQTLDERLLLASPDTIAADAALDAHMTALAEAAVASHCAGCHGADLQGRTGVPNLVDYDWLWGVTGMEMTTVEPVLEIMQTILYGVRNTNCPDAIKRYGGCPDTRQQSTISSTMCSTWPGKRPTRKPSRARRPTRAFAPNVMARAAWATRPMVAPT